MKANIKYDKILVNLTEAMKDSNLSDIRKSLKGKILDSPGSPVPDCAKLDVKIGNPSPIMLDYGIVKKLNTSITIKRGKNSGINRYATHQILRLDKLKENPTSYGNIALLTMKRSNTFRVMALNHVFFNWHRKYPLSYIININRKVSKLINLKISALDYKRAYIPKGDKDGRPLGVPKPEGRMLLHMYNNFLVFYLKDKLSKSQHGFIPGRGTMTAWQEILRKNVMKKPFVKEWDFRKYFDTVNIDKIFYEMVKMKVPLEVNSFLLNVNRSLIQLQEDEKISEDLAKGRIRYSQATTSQLDAVNAYGNQVQFDGYDPGFVEYDEPFMRGVPQGSPTSPTLGNILMDCGINHEGSKEPNKAKIIAYADDSLGYSKNYFKEDVDPDGGISVNKAKSGWIRYNGKTIKPLKFLGLIGDGVTISADTRKGSKLGLTAKIREMFNLIDQTRYDLTLTRKQAIDYLQNRADKQLYNGKAVDSINGEKGFISKLAGGIQARLYAGTGDKINDYQDFSMSFKPDTGMASKLAKSKEIPEIIDIFNSSSFACTSLLNIFRYNQKLRRERKLDWKIKVKPESQ